MLEKKEQLKRILQELQESTSNLEQICDLFQDNLDYFNENDRNRINEFNKIFDLKVQKIDEKIKSFVRFVEKSFALIEEEKLQEVVNKMCSNIPESDKWTTRQKINYIKKIFRQIYKKNPEPEKAFPLTYNFEWCLPSSIEICGEKRNIFFWDEALFQVVNVVCGDNKSLLINFISQDKSNKSMFSLTPSTYERPLEIINGIYIESKSTCDMLKACCKLLDIYGVSYDNVHIYLSHLSK